MIALRWRWPAIAATTRRRGVERAQRRLPAVGPRERLVGEDDHVARAGPAQLAAQPGDLRRRHEAALPAGAVDDVEHDAAHRGADVEAVVEPSAVAPAAAEPPQRLGRAHEVPRGIGGHRARAPGEAAVEQRGDRRLGVGPGGRPQARVERLDHAVAGRDRLDRGGRRRLALGEQVVVAEHRIPRRVEPGRVERALRGGEQPGVARGVVVGAVVEGVGVVGLLHAVVARGAGVGMDTAAGEDGAGGVELVGLRVVDEVARDRHRLRVQAVERADGGGEDLGGQRLLGPEDGAEDAAEPVEERARARATPRRARGRR